MSGADNPRGQNFDVNRNHFEFWLYTIFFYDLILLYSPGAGVDSPQGTKSFDVNRKALSFYTFVVSFKEISLKSDFMQ